MHGSKDRAKDASPHVCHDLSCPRGLHALLGAHADVIPLLGDLRTSAVTGALPTAGGNPLSADGPTKAFFPTPPREERRLPEDRDAFHRYDTRGNRCSSKGLLPPALAPALSLTPPTLGLPWEAVLLKGIARSQCGHPRIRDVLFESADAFFTRRDPRAWD